MKRSILFALALAMAAGAPVDAGDLRDGYTPQHLAPKSVSDACAQLGGTFAELRTAIDITGAQSAAAGGNAGGLGYWSPNKQFRSVEDNFIVVNKMLEPSLDEVTDLPIALDQTPVSAAKTAALGLADAYEKSLRQIKQYALAAVVFERAAHGRRKAQIETLGLYNGNYSQNRNRNDREMSADQARAILDGESSDVKDASRQLKLPEYRWQHACPDAPIVHHQETDTMIAPAELAAPSAPSASGTTVPATAAPFAPSASAAATPAPSASPKSP